MVLGQTLTRKEIERQNTVSLLKMKIAPEHELLMYADRFEPVINWILNNFDYIKSAFADLYDQGQFVPEPGFGGNNFKNSIENQIISIATCTTIVTAVEWGINGLNGELIAIYNNRYYEHNTLKQTAEALKISIGQVSKREEDIRFQIIQKLDEEEITPSNLFWFYEKYHKKI
jgi:hypothetical protein